MERKAIAVVILGVIVGTTTAFLVVPAPSGPSASDPSADTSDQQSDTAGEAVTYTVDTQEGLADAKMHTNAAVRDGALQIAPGKRGFRFYESPTYRLASLDRLIVNVTLPRPNQSTATVAVRTSSNAAFSRNQSGYYTTGENRFTLQHGRNVFEVPAMPDSYYRVWFGMTRAGVNISSPKITGYQISGTHEPGTDIVAYRYS